MSERPPRKVFAAPAPAATTAEPEPGPEVTVADLRTYLSEAATVSWSGVDEVARSVGIKHWALAGGQMVMIHMAIHGFRAHRATADADIAVDVRAGGPGAMETVAAALVGAGFEAEMSSDGVTRFLNGSGRVDLLAPEGLKDPVPTIGGGRAIQAPGATQALGRTQLVEVRWSDRSTVVRCPTLFGALVAKAAASAGTTEGRSRRQRHLDDVVALASIMAVAGPGTDAVPTKKDRRRLSDASEMLQDNNPAWLGTDHRGDAVAVLAMLTNAQS